MTLFSSRRERRLWLWVLAVMVAIYATLGLAQTLAETLRERGLLDISIGLFLLCMFLVGATILTQGLKVRPGGAEVAVVIGVATAYLLVFTRMTVPTERSHLIEYGVVGILIYEALTERASQGRRVPLPPLLAVLATATLGVLDEGIQAILPKPRLRSGRHPVQPARRNHGSGRQRGADRGRDGGRRCSGWG